jgi:hypothetical protein
VIAMLECFVSAKANMSAANVKAQQGAGRRQNEAASREALLGIKEMFRKDGLL